MCIHMDSYHFDSSFHNVGSSEDCLIEEYGYYLVSQFWQKNGYSSILQTLSRDLHSFINNLDTLHNHVQTSHSLDLKLPSLKCNRTLNGLLVHYASARKGLAFLIKGMVKAIAKVLFQIEIKITVDSYKEIETTSYLRHKYVFSISLTNQLESNQDALTRKLTETNCQ